jgi:small-conductance mechanosensitive channel
MTESTKETTSQAPESTTNGETTNTTETVKNPEAVLAKNKELLGTLKQIKTEAEELKAWKKEQELKEQQAKGDLEGVINKLREENNTLKGELNDTRKGYASKSIEDQIKQAAISKGCVNADKLMRLLTKDQLSTVQVGDDFRVNNDDLGRLVEELEKEHSDIGLFKKQNVNINHVTGDLKKGMSSDKRIEKMTANEYMEYIKTLNV